MRTSLSSWSCTGGIIVQPVGRLRFFWSGRLVSEDASRLSDSSTVPLSILPDPPHPLSYLSLFYQLTVVYFTSRISVGKLIEDASDYFSRIQTQSHEINTDPGVCLFSTLRAYIIPIFNILLYIYCSFKQTGCKDIVDRFSERIGKHTPPLFNGLNKFVGQENPIMFSPLYPLWWRHVPTHTFVFRAPRFSYRKLCFLFLILVVLLISPTVVQLIWFLRWRKINCVSVEYSMLPFFGNITFP